MQVDPDTIRKFATEDWSAKAILFLVCLALGYVVWRAISWAEKRGGQLVDRMIKHLDDVGASMGSLVKMAEKNDELHRRNEEAQKRLEAKVDQVFTRIQIIDDRLDGEKDK